MQGGYMAEQRDTKLPGGSEMTKEVSGPPEGHPANMGARGGVALGSVVIFHGRVEQPFDNDGPPLGSYHGEVKALPKDQ
jgi:hypothetical protein